MSNLTDKNFLPEVLSSGYLGLTAQRAQIKTDYRDGSGAFWKGSQLFVVQEQHTPKHRCTTNTTPDLSAEEAYFLEQGKGEYVAVTLVKCQMTTWDAVDELANLLGIHEDRISTAGLKDRWATTGQRVHIRLGGKLTYEAVVRACCPVELKGKRGFFIKDPTRVDYPLSNGKMDGNHFTITVLVPGFTKAEIEEYVEQRLTLIGARGMTMPNAFGKQRLGRRQNLHLIGHTLIHEGAEAAIIRFLTETSPNEGAYHAEIRNKLAQVIEQAQAEAQATGKGIDELWNYWDLMRGILDPVKSKLNMVVEYMIVEQVLTDCDFHKAMSRPKLRNKMSLWVGAYQSFWFNQALARAVTGKIKIKGNSIPLYVDDRAVNRWYRDHGCPEAVPQVIDPKVRELFLERNGNSKGPWRKAFIPVRDYKVDEVSDGVWKVQFLLRSGAYATVFIGLIFNIEGDDEEESK